MGILINLLISSLAVFITAYFLPGVHLNNFGTAVIVAFLLGLVNTFIKPILTILTFPITIITLGLFMFVINALVIWIVDYLVDGFSVDNFLWALIFSFIVSIISSLLKSLKI